MSVRYEHLHTILHKPFLSVSVLASVLGSVNMCTPERQFTKCDCEDIYYKYKVCQVNPVSCCSSKLMYPERTCLLLEPADSSLCHCSALNIGENVSFFLIFKRRKKIGIPIFIFARIRF